MQNDDLSAAERDLQWILDNRSQGVMGEVDEGLILTASLRLGRVILAQGDAERALDLVNTLDPSAFEGALANCVVIFISHSAVLWMPVMPTAAQQAGSSSDGLRMKLDNLPD